MIVTYSYQIGVICLFLNNFYIFYGSFSFLFSINLLHIHEVLSRSNFISFYLGKFHLLHILFVAQEFLLSRYWPSAINRCRLQNNYLDFSPATKSSLFRLLFFKVKMRNVFVTWIKFNDRHYYCLLIYPYLTFFFHFLT